MIKEWRLYAPNLAGIISLGIILTMSINAFAEHKQYQIKTEGATLHVETDGDRNNTPLLMWNGAYCTTNMWDMVIPELSDNFFVIRFDVRGTGLSSPSATDEGYRMERHADDAVAILDYLNIEKSVVWSMAWGSRAAIIYSARHPEKVTHLALYDASVDPADVQEQGRLREIAFKKQVDGGMPLLERPANWNHHLNAETSRKGIGAIRFFKDQEGQLAKIKAPTLVCIGDHDPNLEPSKKIARLIDSAELVIMDTVAHGSVLQRPDLTTTNFLNFMKKHNVIE
jgi:pimeloyl-ACP methyl ester carboxylesterase